MRLGRIILHLKIIDLIAKNRIGLVQYFQFRGPGRRARDLLFYQIGMIEVKMHITTVPHQLAGFQITLLRDHPDQQRRGKHVERKAETQVAAALIEYPGQFAAGNVKLVGLVAGRQRHLVQFRSPSPAGV